MFVLSIIEYATTIYSPQGKEVIRKLDDVQYNFTRKTMTGDTARNWAHGLQTLELRRRRNDMVILYKTIFNVIQVDRRMPSFRGSVKLLHEVSA